jgi:hypothetical protein
MLIVRSERSCREKFTHAVRQAAAADLRVDERDWRWPWARHVEATISENGGCACGLLSDEADWNADFWAMRPEILEPLARTLQILIDQGPPHLTVAAAWLVTESRQTVNVTAAELVALARSSRLGTRTNYEVTKAQ